MGKYLFPNFDNNEWITKYNDLVLEVASHEKDNKFLKQMQPKRNDKEASSISKDFITIHHIIPKKVVPGLTKDKDNFLYVNFVDHCNLHYYLWKADPKYASHLMFIAYAGRKLGIWDMPNGEEEWKQLSKDTSLYRKLKKLNNK